MGAGPNPPRADGRWPAQARGDGANAEEALALGVEGLDEPGRSLDTGIIRRTFPPSA